MLQDLKTMSHKKLFLYGYFLGYSVGLLLSMSLSIYINDYISILITIPSLIFVFFLFFHYQKHIGYDFATLGLLWSSSIVVFFHVLHNDFTLDVAFLLIIPMAAAIMLSKTHIVWHGTLYVLIALALFIYGYLAYPEHPFLHDSKLMASFTVLSFFVFAFGATYHFAISQSYERLEKANKQKAFLLKEIHHRVKNNLNIVASILGLEKFESNTEEVHKLIAQNKLRIESIAMVHEILYKSEDLENIDFKTYLSKLTEHILATESREDNIRLHLDIVELKLSIEAMIQFGIIINELVTNSIKHAFGEKAENEEGNIYITLQKHEVHYVLTYKDDGVGLHSKHKGFGQNLISISAQQLGAEVKMTSQDGLSYTFSFSKENT